MLEVQAIRIIYGKKGIKTLPTYHNKTDTDIEEFTTSDLDEIIQRLGITTRLKFADISEPIGGNRTLVLPCRDLQDFKMIRHCEITLLCGELK